MPGIGSTASIPAAIAGGGTVARLQALAAGAPATPEPAPQAQARPRGETTALNPAFSGGAQTALVHLQELAGR